MRTCRLTLVLTLTLILGLLPGALASANSPDAYPHWAAPVVANLANRMALVVLADLDQPISPGAWNQLVATVMDRTSGPAEHAQDSEQYWLWIYTGAMSAIETIARQDAIGGLMKLINVFGGRGLEENHPEALARFSDADGLTDHQRHLVAHAVVAGLVGGYPDGTLRPTALLTNAEALVLAERLILTLESAHQPDPFAGLPWPMGFGVGFEPPLPFEPDGFMSTEGVRGGSGEVFLIMHGAAFTAVLPGAQVANHSETHSLHLSTQVRWGLEDGHQIRFRREMDHEAIALLGSPFALPEAVLAPGENRRALAAFAVPVGTQAIWYHMESALGPVKEPTHPWNAAQRGLIGDL